MTWVDHNGFMANHCLMLNAQLDNTLTIALCCPSLSVWSYFHRRQKYGLWEELLSSDWAKTWWLRSWGALVWMQKGVSWGLTKHRDAMWNEWVDWRQRNNAASIWVLGEWLDVKSMGHLEEQAHLFWLYGPLLIWGMQRYYANSSFFACFRFILLNLHAMLTKINYLQLFFNWCMVCCMSWFIVEGCGK